MQKRLLCLAVLLFLLCSFGAALDRQPAADYHVRREALAKKAGGVDRPRRAPRADGRRIRVSSGR